MAYKPTKIIFFDDYITDPEFEKRMDNFWEEKWLPIHSFDKEEFFHYSNIDGLQGIIENREIWFTHILSMNDPQEIDYGRTLVNEKLDKRIEKEENKFIRSFLNSTKVSTSSFGRMIHQTFVACFCESPKILSQWRNYGDSGGGYCLGIKVTEKSQILQKVSGKYEKYKPYLRKVIYSKEKQNQLVDEILETTINHLRSLLGKIQADDKKKDFFSASISAILSNILIDMILSFKMEAFQEEQEWRLLRVILDNEERDILKFRRKGNELIPFISSSIITTEDDKDYFSLSSLFYGPSLRKEGIANTLRLYLSSQKVKVDKYPFIEDTHIPVQGMDYFLNP